MSNRGRLLAALGAIAIVTGAFYFILRPTGHNFELHLEEPIDNATLVVNDERIPMVQDGDWMSASWDGADGMARIVVTHRDGSSTTCTIGYITNGEHEPHVASLSGKDCFGHVES